jgi:hypothetical protein
MSASRRLSTLRQCGLTWVSAPPEKRMLTAVRHRYRQPRRSSNASSNTDVPARTDGQRLGCRSHGQPTHGTDSDGFERDRARLLIRGLRVRAADSSLVVGLDHPDQLTVGRSPADHQQGAGGTNSSAVPIVEAIRRDLSGCWRLALPIESWEPSGEPSSPDTGPHRAYHSVRFLLSTSNLATMSHVGRRHGSRSHRGGQGFKSPQLD